MLSHYKAVVWYLGDNRYTQDQEDFVTDRRRSASFLDIAVAEREQYLTMAVRDFMNEGGKLINMGELAQDGGGLDQLVGGAYYALNGDETAECVVTDPDQGLFDDCLILANDFRQYYLGAFTRVEPRRAEPVPRHRHADPGLQARAERHAVEPARRGGRLPADQRRAAGVASSRSSRSQGAAEYDFTGDPFTPVEGTNYAAARARGRSYMRLTKTINLRGVTAAANPRLTVPALLRTSRTSYDHVFVEARTPAAGQLDDAAGRSRIELDDDVPAECDARASCSSMHPLLTPLPHAGRTARRRARRDVERVHGLHRRLGADVRVRPGRLRGPAGRALDLLRDRPGRPAASARSWTTRAC